MLKLNTDFIIILGVLDRVRPVGLETTLSQKERHLSRFWYLSLSLFVDFRTLAVMSGTSMMPLHVKMFFSGSCFSWHCLADTKIGTRFFLVGPIDGILSKLSLRLCAWYCLKAFLEDDGDCYVLMRSRD